MVIMVEEVDEAEKIEIVEKPGPSGTAERPVTPDDIKKRRKRRRGVLYAIVFIYVLNLANLIFQGIGRKKKVRQLQ